MSGPDLTRAQINSHWITLSTTVHQGECNRDLPQLCPLHPCVPEELQVRGEHFAKNVNEQISVLSRKKRQNEKFPYFNFCSNSSWQIHQFKDIFCSLRPFFFLNFCKIFATEPGSSLTDSRPSWTGEDININNHYHHHYYICGQLQRVWEQWGARCRAEDLPGDHHHYKHYHHHHHHHDQDGLLVINSVTRQPPTKEQLNLRPNRRLLRPETQEVQYSPGVHVYRSSYTGLCGWGWEDQWASFPDRHAHHHSPGAQQAGGNMLQKIRKKKLLRSTFFKYFYLNNSNRI